LTDYCCFPYNKGMDIEKLAKSAFHRYRTVPNYVADALREAILRGELKGGQPLRQEEIARDFGVSRIPVREALCQLEGEGVVTILPHRGAIVSTLSAAEIAELFELRELLEAEALRLAMSNRNEAAIAGAAALLEESDRADDPARLSELNRRFHLALYTPAGRPRLLALIEKMNADTNRYLRIGLSLMQYQATSQAEHRRLLEAYCAGREAAAQSVLRGHIAAAGKRLIQYLTEENKIQG